MGILSNIFRRFGGSVLIGGSYGARRGGPVDALKVAAVYRCVRIISDSIASMRLEYQRKRADGVYVPFVQADVFDLLTVQPCERYSAFSFWSLAVRRMLLEGAAYILPVREGVRIVSLELINTDGISYDADKGVYQVTDTRLPETLRRYYYERELVVLRGATALDGLPEAVKDCAADAIALAALADRESAKRVANGGAPLTLITGGGMRGMVMEGLTDKQVTDTAEEMNRALEDDKRFIFQPAGTESKQLGESAAALQLQAIREFTVREVCRFFGVPPIFVYSDGSSNYKSAEMASADFLTNTLDPILNNIEAELRRKLIPRAYWHTQRITFERTGRLALDLSSRAAWYKSLVELGVKSVNDLRLEFNEAPIEGGDRVFVSANLKGIDETNNNQSNE